jgi:magnesium chelatase subunit I
MASEPEAESTTLERWSFPFTGLVGQERMKLALILNAINPSIGGVLIRGERGTAKSTAVRALARLLPEQEIVEGCRYGCDPDDLKTLCSDCRDRITAGENPLPRARRKMRVVELPINASEDRVVGTIDLEAALKEGAKRFEPGVLADAHRNILYVDEVNLLDDHIVDALLDAAAMGTNVVEREGVSVMHPARFILVGTMNPEEGELRPQLLDRFGLCVDVIGIRDIEQRIQIAEKSAKWSADPAAFTKAHAKGDEAVKVKIAEAMKLLPSVETTRSILTIIARLSITVEVDGHRADLVCGRAAAAKAAYDGINHTDTHNIIEVADMVYSHRRHTPTLGKDAQTTGEIITRILAGEARRSVGAQTKSPSKRALPEGVLKGLDAGGVGKK